MEFKGIAWVGNIYQKFEAMCLEVEEAMYEDTVKYMENQAQKVGGSVKKFYSEIMQDILPPSCVASEKDAAGDYLLSPYGQMDVSKKPRLSVSDRYGQLKKSEVEFNSDFAEEEEHISVLRETNCYSPPPVVLVENIYSDDCSTKNKKLGAYRRAVGIKRITRSTNHPEVCSSPGGGSLPACERICGLDKTAKKITPFSAVSVDATTASGKIASTEFVRKVKDDSECISVASHKIISAKNPVEKKAVSESLASSPHLPDQPTGETAENHNVREVDCAGTIFTTSNEAADKPMKNTTDITDSEIRIDTGNPEPTGEEVTPPFEDYFDVEFVEKAELTDPGIDAIEMSNLEETCILVEATEALELFPREHRSQYHTRRNSAKLWPRN